MYSLITAKSSRYCKYLEKCRILFLITIKPQLCTLNEKYAEKETILQ